MKLNARLEREDFVSFELDDPEVEHLLLLAARTRRMDPSDYFRSVVICELYGTKPPWRQDSPGG